MQHFSKISFFLLLLSYYLNVCLAVASNEASGEKCTNKTIGVKSFELNATEKQLNDNVKETGQKMKHIVEGALTLWKIVLDSRLGMAASKYIGSLEGTTKEALNVLDSLQPNTMEHALVVVKNTLETNRQILTDAGLPLKMIPNAIDPVWVSLIGVLIGKEFGPILATTCE